MCHVRPKRLCVESILFVTLFLTMTNASHIIIYHPSLTVGRLSDMKLRLKALEKRNLVCLRPECNYREFKSQMRYDTHMSLHFQRDEEHKKVLKQNRENERLKWEKETNYRGKLRHINESLKGVPGENDDEVALVLGGGFGPSDGIPDGLSLSTHR